MAKAKLPPKLAHWQPILDRLRAVPAERLDDEGAFDFIFEFLEQHFGARKVADADEQLEAEREELKRLAAQNGADPMLEFLSVWISPQFAGEVSMSDDIEPPLLSAIVTLPGNLRRRDDYGSMYAEGDGLKISIIPTAASTFEFRRKNLIRRNFDESAFQCGNASGWKLESTDPRLLSRKHINYFVTVPGGAVHVEVNADESIEIASVESVFDNLTVRTEE